MDFNEEVGIYLVSLWRFGPLYATLSLAAQAFLMGIPVTISRPGIDEILFRYDGNEVGGHPEYIPLITECVKVLENDLTGVINNWISDEILYNNSEKEESIKKNASEYSEAL